MQTARNSDLDKHNRA